MFKLDVLKNDGVFVLNKPALSPEEKTVIVLGLARGGTTMVASVLQALGVPMEEKRSLVLEDVELSQAVESRNALELENIIAQRNKSYPVWGWKRPSAINYTDVWQDCFRNPHFIIIFRDPFAIANRNRISVLSDVFSNMENSIKQLNVLLNFARQETNPVLLCSYEKVLTLPENFVAAIENFLDLKASELTDNAVSQITPAPEKYLKASRNTQSKGVLAKVNRRFCSGWAFYVKQPKRAAKVQILINDQLVHLVTAQLPCPDVKKNGLHPTGHCGFMFEWPANLIPKLGDKIEARVEGDIKSLNNSPQWILAPKRIS